MLNKTVFTFSEVTRKITNHNVIHNVCDNIRNTASFNALQTDEKDKFRSAVRSQISDVENVLINNEGYQRYAIGGATVDLYPCTDVDDSKKYFLSSGYENDRTFLLFIYNKSTMELSLEAVVEENVLPFSDQDFDTGYIELPYNIHRKNYHLYVQGSSISD